VQGNTIIRAPMRVDIVGEWTDTPFYLSHDREGNVVNYTIPYFVVSIAWCNNGIRGLTLLMEDEMMGRGLGSSGSWNTALVRILHRLNENEEYNEDGTLTDKFCADVAEQAHKFANMMGHIGGRQDEYASAYTGINYWKFRGDKVDRCMLSRIDELTEYLNERALLFGLRNRGNRDSADIHKAIIAQDEIALSTIDKINECAQKFINMVRKGVMLDRCFAILNMHRFYQKMLCTQIVSREVNDILEREEIKDSILSWKMCGAGGECGFALVIAQEGKKEALSNYLSTYGIVLDATVYKRNTNELSENITMGGDSLLVKIGDEREGIGVFNPLPLSDNKETMKNDRKN